MTRVHYKQFLRPSMSSRLPMLQKYTEALTLCPGWSGTSCCYAMTLGDVFATSRGGAVLLVNRALCQKKKNVWNLVQQDAAAALAIDSHLVKVGYRPYCRLLHKHTGSMSAESSFCC